MSQQTRVTIVVALFFVVVLSTWPAFLMPNWLYQGIHGWRYPDSGVCGAATATDYGPRGGSRSGSRFRCRITSQTVTAAHGKSGRGLPPKS